MKKTQSSLLMGVMATVIVGGLLLMYFDMVPTEEAPPVTSTTLPVVPETGTGIQKSYDMSTNAKVTLSVVDCEQEGTTVSAADTVWYVKDGGTWAKKETDSNTATPDLQMPPETEYRALVYDDSTYTGKIISGVMPYSGNTVIPVCLYAIDTTPTVILWSQDDGNKISSSNAEPMDANTTYDEIGYTIRVSQYQHFNKPALCFDYNSTYDEVKETTVGMQAPTPDFLKGTVEECWYVPTISSGGSSTGYLSVDTGIGPVGGDANITYYLVDTQYYIHTLTNEIASGFNIEDGTTNIGDSTDSTAAGTLGIS